MDFNTFALATGVVALAEIGDKTQLLSLMLAGRYPKQHWAIIAGIFLATILNHALAAWLGHWLTQWFDPQWLQWILGGSFIAIGLWLLIPDKLDENQATPPVRGFIQVLGITTALFFIAEMGDKTQLATVALGARYDDLFATVIGTTLGMMLANAPAVWLGQRFTKWLPERWVRAMAAIIFIAIGISSFIFLN